MEELKKYMKFKYDIDIFRGPDEAYIIEYNTGVNKKIQPLKINSSMISRQHFMIGNISIACTFAIKMNPLFHSVLSTMGILISQKKATEMVLFICTPIPLFFQIYN